MGKDDERLDAVTLIGGTFSPEEFARYLEDTDPCFGTHHAKSAPECRDCIAPVIVDGELLLLRDLCRARSQGARSPSQIRRLTTQEILSRLEAGQAVPEVFAEVLGDADPEVAGVDARQLLYQRFRYIQKQKGLPVPDLPPTKDLVDHVRNPEVD